MQAIIYKSFLPKQETSQPEETHISPPSGIYRPQYNWKDQEQEDNTSQQETQPSQEVVVSPENTPTWTNPTGTTIISDINDPIYKTNPTETTIVSDVNYPTYRTPVTTPRGKHQFKSSDIQVGNMKELLDRFADAGISLRITSGYRPGATTSSGNPSWHAEGYALDITPIAGQTYENLKQQLKENPELVKWMQDNGFGIIDETTPEMQSRTGATGAHWHIGKDKLAQSGLQAILSARSGTKLPIIYAKPGRKLKKQRNRVTEQLLSINNPRYQDPLTNTDKPLEPVSIASILPGTGDVAEGASIINDISKGNIGSALLGTTLFLIPGNIPQILRKRPKFQNFKEIKTYLTDRLDSETLSKLNIPETINGKPIKDILNDIPMEIGDASHKGGALYDAEKNKIIIDKDFPIEMYGEAIDHELLHALDYLSKNNIQRYSGDVPIVLGSRKLYQRTINDDNIYTSELAAKLVQLKNKAGLSKNQNLTGQQWKSLVEKYSSNPKYNGISQLLNQVKDWDALAKWARKAVPVTIAFPTIPNFVNNGNDKKEMSTGNEK